MAGQPATVNVCLLLQLLHVVAFPMLCHPAVAMFHPPNPDVNGFWRAVAVRLYAQATAVKALPERQVPRLTTLHRFMWTTCHNTAYILTTLCWLSYLCIRLKLHHVHIIFSIHYCQFGELLMMNLNVLLMRLNTATSGRILTAASRARCSTGSSPLFTLSACVH